MESDYEDLDLTDTDHTYETVIVPDEDNTDLSKKDHKNPDALHKSKNDPTNCPCPCHQNEAELQQQQYQSGHKVMLGISTSGTAAGTSAMGSSKYGHAGSVASLPILSTAASAEPTPATTPKRKSMLLPLQNCCDNCGIKVSIVTLTR